MGTVRESACKRKTLDIGESTMWFLAVFAFLSGVSQDGPVIDFSTLGILPAIRIEALNVILATFCLVIAAVVLIEPFFPGDLGKRTKTFRCSVHWKAIRGIVLLATFILGLTAGLDMLIENLPTFSWLINAMTYGGFVITIVITLNVILDVFSELLRLLRNNHA